MASLRLQDIYKVYQSGVVAVTDFTLDIEDKEFIVFVGPSGCGKSTTLRMIAGLEEISDGELYIDGKLMNNVQPKDRDIAMVFQNYALYPHMTVYDNMAFGLKLRKKPKAEIDEKVKEAARILGLETYLQRKPKALSGGQRQRVALGRAIVREPKVFLMDEPLSNLDAKLRVKMREEIREIQKKYEITMVFVTHDQEEAMVLGDQIAIMDEGRLVQIGKPEDVYLHPQNAFARDFLGISNQFMSTDGVKICCRPEELEFSSEGIVKGTVIQEEFLGFYRQYYIETENHENIIVRTAREKRVEIGNQIFLRLK